MVVELWRENRKFTKATIADVCWFGIALGILALSHWALDKMEYPTQKKQILETVHFWGYFASILVFLLSFILEIVIYKGKGIAHSLKE